MRTQEGVAPVEAVEGGRKKRNGPPKVRRLGVGVGPPAPTLPLETETPIVERQVTVPLPRPLTLAYSPSDGLQFVVEHTSSASNPHYLSPPSPLQLSPHHLTI